MGVVFIYGFFQDSNVSLGYLPGKLELRLAPGNGSGSRVPLKEMFEQVMGADQSLKFPCGCVKLSRFASRKNLIESFSESAADGLFRVLSSQ